jgi:prepilin-type N-terminal cleavage/methylation domain-containing protein
MVKHPKLTFFTKADKGFTLVELLVAIAISAFIIAGTYEILNSVITSRSRLASEYLEAEITDKLNNLLNKDFRESVQDSFKMVNDIDKKTFSFKTYNSIFFNNAMAVTVSYYIEQDYDTGEYYFVREEDKKDMDFSLKIRLLPNVKKFKISFYNGTEYNWEYLPSNLLLYKLSFVWNNVKYEIPVGKLQ